MLRVHPVMEKLSAMNRNEDIKTLEGYVASSTEEVTRLCTDLNGDLYVDIPTKNIVHDDNLPGDKSGKVRVFVSPSARIEVGVQTQAALLNDREGTYCGDSGTMYCWRRIRTADGTYIIIMKPCGSCIPDRAVSTNNVFAL